MAVLEEGLKEHVGQVNDGYEAVHGGLGLEQEMQKVKGT